MSLDAIRWSLAVPAAHRRAPDRPSAEALRTLAYLASRESDGVTWVSTGRMALDRGIDRTTARRHLNQLAKHGLIAEVPAMALTGTAAAERYAKGSKRNPTIWKLALPSEDLCASVPNDASEDLCASRSEALSASASDAHSASPIEGTAKEQVEGATAMPSRAYEDLGGHGNPAPTRFPKQCPRHQDREHHEPCGACGAARARHDEQLEQQRAARKQQAADERRAETRERWAAIRECRYCDERGYQPNGRVCPRDDDGRHFWMNHPEMVAS